MRGVGETKDLSLLMRVRCGAAWELSNPSFSPLILLYEFVSLVPERGLHHVNSRCKICSDLNLVQQVSLYFCKQMS